MSEDNRSALSQSPQDQMYMRQALSLAAKGAGFVNPNPQVGCVLVKDGQVIGQGWHTAFGKLHAEREALADCRTRGNDPAGATAYVTLEPCCHYGKTPPCTEGLIEAGVARVVMGAPDPNPLVAGKGVAALRAAGVQVTEGVLVEECQAANKEWLYYIQHKRPYVIAKWAQTLDGAIGLEPGKTCWLTGETARARTHADRRRCAAIMVGIGTVLADDPTLTCRLDGPVKQPLRVVVDAHLRIPLDSCLVQSADQGPVLIVAAEDAPAEKVEALTRAGVEVLILPLTGSGLAQVEEGQPLDTGSLPPAAAGLDLPRLLDELGARGVDSLIVEGGPTLLASFFREGLVNGMQIYMAPRVFGGKAVPSLGDLGTGVADLGLVFALTNIEQLGQDVLIEGEVS